LHWERERNDGGDRGSEPRTRCPRAWTGGCCGRARSRPLSGGRAMTATGDASVSLVGPTDARVNSMDQGARLFSFDELPSADLIVDAAYAGGRAGTYGDDPISRLLPVGNRGGFRTSGSPRRGGTRFVVLYTTGTDPDWPD